MLYPFREAQRLFLEPLAAWAAASERLVPNVPFSGFARANFELLHRLSKGYPKPSFGIPHEVVLSKPFCDLLRFEPMLPRNIEAPPKVLLFAPLSGHHATLLRDTVRTLLPEHDVYVTDWLDARLVPLREGTFSLDDYVAYAIEFLRFLGPDVHAIAVCQPSVPVLAAASILASLGDPRAPRSLTLMGGPVDTRRGPTEVTELAKTHDLSWFERNLIHRVPFGHPGAGRRVYPGFLQLLAFVSMNPARHAESHMKLYADVVRGDRDAVEAHRAFYDEYNAVLDMDAPYYLDTVRVVFQEHLLPRGEWTVRFEGRDVRVDPAAIRDTALFTVEGELDDISGLGQTEAAQGLCSSIPADRRRHHVAPGVGHYGLFSGRRFREEIHPRLCAFIADS